MKVDITSIYLIIGIAASIHDVSQFWKLDDSILRKIETSDKPELMKAKELILRIQRRDLYQFCNEYIVPKDQLPYFNDITANDIVCSQKAGDKLKAEDVAVVNVKIDWTDGTKNPLDRVSFFQDYESNDKFKISVDHVGNLLPTFYQDKIVRVYSKKPDQVAAVSYAFENFQLKTYGRKRQIHDTPGKKQRVSRSLELQS